MGTDEHHLREEDVVGNGRSSSSSGSRSSSGRSSSSRGGSVGGGGSFGGGSSRTTHNPPSNPLDALSYCQEITTPDANHRNKSNHGRNNNSSLTRTLRALFRSQIEMDESIVYGGGYRSGSLHRTQ
jgi:hypothetical protein